MSDLETTSVLSFGKINHMPNKAKGTLGEALAGIWLKEQIKKGPSIIADKKISEFDPRFWFSRIGRHQCRYGKVGDDDLEKISWEPDYRFHVTLPDYDVRKETLIEAKTGDSGLERNQLEVMKLVSQREERLYSSVKLLFKTNKRHSPLKRLPIKTLDKK